jgi:hypothetical protein
MDFRSPHSGTELARRSHSQDSGTRWGPVVHDPTSRPIHIDARENSRTSAVTAQFHAGKSFGYVLRATNYAGGAGCAGDDGNVIKDRGDPDSNGIVVIPVKFAQLLVFARRLAAMHIMHCLSVKFCAMLRWPFAFCRKRPMVTLAIVEVMIDVPVEMVRPVKPGSGADEDTACEPFGPVVAVWSAIVGRSLIIPVRANRRFSDGDCNLSIRRMRCGDEKPRG